MSNKSNGTAFEREFARMLAGHDFWVHCIQDNANGQPFDVIAARDGVTYVFDCKDCRQERFPLSRIEENQKTAMELWWGCGNTEPLFVIRFPVQGVRLASFSVLMEMERAGHRSLQGNGIMQYTTPFERWMSLL